MIIAAGLIAGVGFYCLSQAYKSAPVSVISSFEYTYLPWAILWGFVFWQEVPDGWSVLGLCLIAGSGLFVMYRERIARGERKPFRLGFRSRLRM